tara:strand:- start:239 stop:496 length:258 start_codon:yes stop_codon:yes gene_type:complete
MIKLLLILIYFFFRRFSRLFSKKKVSKAKKILIFDKKNLNNWMNLTKKERFNLSKQESINYLTKRKVLLEEIRKEYKKISKRKSK